MMDTFSPLAPEAGFCLVVPGFLTRDECRQHIEASEARGFSGAQSAYPPSYRNNDRQVLDDAALAARLAQRLAAHAPGQLQREGAAWAFDGINERLRFCRYRAGQQFEIHQDGVHHRGHALRSCLTFMVYLTDGDAFEGGDTLFFSAGPAGNGKGAPPEVRARVRPRAGSLILFDHALWHAGEAVTRGVKHILRSDVLYRRLGEAPLAAGPFEPGHEGYVWTLAHLADGSIASGGRDTLIRLWHADGRAAGQLAGHAQSVLGLAALPGGGLASVSRDGSLRLWDVAARSCTSAVAAHEGSGLTVALLADGAIATGGADAQVRLWSPSGEPMRALHGHEGWVWSVTGLGDGQLASAAEDGTVRVWSLDDGRCLHVLRGATALRDVLALPGGDRLLCAGIDGRIAMWSRRGERWAQAGTWQAHAAAVRRLRRLGSDCVASAGEDNRVRVWRLAEDLGDLALVAESRHENFATDVLPLPGAYLSCSYDGRIVRHATP